MGSGKEPPWSNLRYYPGTCLEGLRKTTRNLIAVSRPGYEGETSHILYMSAAKDCNIGFNSSEAPLYLGADSDRGRSTVLKL